MKHKTIYALMVAAGLAFAAPMASANDARATMLSNTCAGCHGTHGNSTGPAIPSIAGMGADAFTDAMMAYKDDSRPSTIMGRIAKGYSEEDIAAMSGYFSKQSHTAATQDADAAAAEKGAKLHEKYCEKCHEDNGSLAEESGALAGQWKPYLQYSMEDFISGAREMPKKMKKKVEKLREKEGDDGVAALIEFYASQK